MISVSNITHYNNTETQYTNCKITTDKLVADAQATITRVVMNGCDNELIYKRIDNLENSLINHLNEIKTLIQQLIDTNNQVDYFYVEKNLNHENVYIQSPRQSEIDEFNDTVSEIPESNEKIYTYYWKVDNIKQKFLVWKTGVFERSNTFYIKNSGFAMFIKFTPKYFPDGTVFISVGLTKGCFDDQLNWPFHHTLQIQILDHSPKSSRQDRKSRSWDPSTVCPSYFWERPQVDDNPECVGTSIPRFIITNKYLWKDSLYIKLIVYL
ncbi:uncharacterized protein [Chelonus insularis]|uniref:uncharacterized protein n=1 Tax=Chelonus insularis TaxID=460826 RepID=UPI00158D8526|nr:uncharacterized protein LOC118070612 [Chelonus insularis]